VEETQGEEEGGQNPGGRGEEPPAGAIEEINRDQPEKTEDITEEQMDKARVGQVEPQGRTAGEGGANPRRRLENQPGEIEGQPGPDKVTRVKVLPAESEGDREQPVLVRPAVRGWQPVPDPPGPDPGGQNQDTGDPQ